jgi:hypothetical protein
VARGNNVDVLTTSTGGAISMNSLNSVSWSSKSGHGGEPAAPPLGNAAPDPSANLFRQLTRNCKLVESGLAGRRPDRADSAPQSKSAGAVSGSQRRRRAGTGGSWPKAEITAARRGGRTSGSRCLRDGGSVPGISGGFAPSPACVLPTQPTDRRFRTARRACRRKPANSRRDRARPPAA